MAGKKWDEMEMLEVSKISMYSSISLCKVGRCLLLGINREEKKSELVIFCILFFEDIT